MIEPVYAVLRRLSCVGVFVGMWSAGVLVQVPPTATLASSGANFRPIEISPRIAALKQRLESGDDHAVAEFWQEIARTGAPLIEPANDNPLQVIVTFLWRGDGGTLGVRLLAPLWSAPGMPNFPLARLPGTNVWYKCWQMRNDLRFTYRFILSVEAGNKESQQDTKVDPLNPHKMKLSLDENGTGTMELSIAAMPHGQEPPWTIKQSSVPAGRVETHQFNSAILANERKIWVYTPPGYDGKTQGAYALLVLFDGFAYKNWIPTPTILDNLIHAGKVPPVIAVMIDNPRDVRISELYTTTRPSYSS